MAAIQSFMIKLDPPWIKVREEGTLGINVYDMDGLPFDLSGDVELTAYMTFYPERETVKTKSATIVSAEDGTCTIDIDEEDFVDNLWGTWEVELVLSTFESRLYFNTLTSDFTVGATVTGADSDASGTIASISMNDDGVSGYLVVEDVAGTFESAEVVEDDEDTPGSATLDYHLNYTDRTAAFHAEAEVEGAVSHQTADIIEEVTSHVSGDGYLSVENVSGAFTEDETIEDDDSETPGSATFVDSDPLARIRTRRIRSDTINLEVERMLESI